MGEEPLRGPTLTARVIALVEGPTEEKFVKDLLAGALGRLGVFISPTTYGRPGNQGGVPSWSKAKRELVGLLKQDANRHVTTMFDYYGMPRSWPGREAAQVRPHAEKANVVEKAIRDGIAASSANDPARIRFIPYVQMHEFEALLFSDPELLGDVVSRDTHLRPLTRQIERIADAFRTPEEIDDDPSKAPAKRIRALAPHYQKVTDGNIAARRIGLHKMRQECPHFAGWLRRLEALGGQP